MIEKCNIYDCLRKYKDEEDNSISDFCSLHGKNEKLLIPNSRECPFFCDKFYCFELKDIITKHEDVHYISDEKDDFWYKRNNGLSANLFTGLSVKGYDISEKRDEWENKHENTDTVVCPYCDYEFESYDNPYEEGEEEIKCDHCGKIFNCETNITYSWTTSKLEEFEG